MITSGVDAIFCIMFLIMMISHSLDTYKLRCATFLYYLICLIIIPAVLMLLAVFGVGWDLVEDACYQLAEQRAREGQIIDEDKCIAIYRGGFLGFLTLGSLL